MHFKCGHHGQALWEASILRIHPKFLQCTIHPIKALHILVMLKLNPQLKREILDNGHGRIIFASPVVDGEYPLWRRMGGCPVSGS